MRPFTSPSTMRYSHQRGATLIELMVGITIGLLTIAVAVGALMVSRGISGTVTDATQIQQQASYAFRVLGQQLRQAGSMQLNLAANKSPTLAILAEDVVAFQPNPSVYSSVPTVAALTPPVSGKDAPTSGQFTLSVAYDNYSEKSFPAGAPASFFRDCLGYGTNVTATPVLLSEFVLNSAELRCGGSGNAAQAIIRNVADFQVRYLVQAGAASGAPTIQKVNATVAATDWTKVFGVEVCLVLYGDEPIEVPDGTTFQDCAGTAVNFSSTGGVPVSQRNRLHLTFHNVYQLRSQGLAG